LAAGLAGLVYLPTLKYDFVWDDKTLIQENPDLDVRNPVELMGRSFAVVQASGEWQRNQYYRPLVSLSLWSDKRLWGLNPFGYHLTNVLLNVLAAVLVALLLSRMLPFFPALLGGLAFALHPMHVESVAFVAGRTDILMTVFLSVAALALVRYRNRPTRGLLAVTVLGFTAALFAKEAAILFPLVALLYLGWPLKRERTGKRGHDAESCPLLIVVILAVVALVYLVVRASVLKGYVPRWEDVTLTQRLLLVVNAFGRYAFLAVVPFLHRVIYPGPAQFAAFGWPTLFGIAAFGALLWLAVRFKGSLPGLGSAWFVAFMLPACNWFPPGVSYLAERLLYLPTAGMVIAVVALGSAKGTHFRAVSPTRPLVRAIGLLVAIYVAAMALNTILRLPVWRDNPALYRAAVREAPDSPDAHDNLGIELKNAGDVQGAIREHRQAVALQPDHASAHNNLGSALFEAGDAQGALREYREAVRLAPDFALAHNNLGVALQQANDLKGAEAEYRQALKLQPGLALAHNNLGEILMSRVKLDSAQAEFRQALASQPDYVLAHFNLGVVQERQGRFDDAEREYRAALQKMPDFQPAQDGLRRIGKGDTMPNRANPPRL
jgi:Flp pilus assembly protein TadD